MKSSPVVLNGLDENATKKIDLSLQATLFKLQESTKLDEIVSGLVGLATSVSADTAVPGTEKSEQMYAALAKAFEGRYSELSCRHLGSGICSFDAPARLVYELAKDAGVQYIVENKPQYVSKY